MRASNINSIISFAENESRINKIRKNINVKGYIRKGKFVRSSRRKQDVRKTVAKVAAISLGVVGTVATVGIASAAATKLRYNRNLVKFGKNIANGGVDIEDMRIPSGVKSKSIPKIRKLDDSKKSISFFIGGMDRAENGQGEKFMRQVKIGFDKQGKDVSKNHELIPLFHNYQVKKDVFVAGKKIERTPLIGISQEIADVFEKATVQGYNKDSVIMANEIYKWHKLNPDKPINLITASAGGFQGREVPHILEAAGVDVKRLMKVFSTATPDYGLVDEIVPTIKVMHNDDLYAKTIPTMKNGLQLPSLHRGTKFIGKGDTPEYRDMIARKGMTDMGNVVTKEKEKFVSGKRYIQPPDRDMPVYVHLGPAYFNGETPTSKKTYHYLYNFMFKD